MKVTESISEDEMIATFLKGEIKSERWKDQLKKLLEKKGIDRQTIENPDVSDKGQNSQRAWLLGEFRGYQRDEKLFTNYPKDIKWKKVVLEEQDFTRLKYINYSYWIELSNGTRKVSAAVKNIKKGIEVFGQSNDQFIELADHIKNGRTFDPVILLASKEDDDLTILEGHVRLTSLLLASDNPKKLEAIVGFSKENWKKPKENSN